MKVFTNENGFTYIFALTIVMVMGIMLGMVSMNAIPDRRQTLLKDGQRVALLLQLAREEAIVRNRPVAFELDSQGFRFYVKSDKEWQLLTDSDLFRERQFKNSPLIISMQPGNADVALPLKIIFGREPVDKPFTLVLSYEDARVAIQADGLGHFVVE